jgi:hypothetical protein
MALRLYLLICFCFIFISVNAQVEEVVNPQQTNVNQSENNNGGNNGAQERKTYTYERSWSFGGNLGLSFWNGGTDILIAPKAYYNVSPKFLTGFGLTYIYSGYKDDFGKYNQNSFGPSIMAAFRPIPYLQFSAEYEGLQTNGNGTVYILGGNNIRSDYSYWNNAIYLGASFVSRNVSFGVRYDVLYDANRSVYSSAWSPVIGFYF